MIQNLLKTALQVIRPETIQYKKYIGTTVNEIGIDVPSYADAIEIKGSIQAHVSQQTIKAFGLDPTKNYKLVNVPAHLISTAESESPDILLFYNKAWTIIKSNDWHTYDGWCKLLVVENKDYNTTLAPVPPEGTND